MRQHNGSTRAWRQLRARILADSDVCHICGRPGADSVDHLVAVDNGGTNELSNLAPAHLSCNQSKGNRPFARIVRHSATLTRPTPRGE